MAAANAIAANALSLIILALILYHSSKRAGRSNTQHRLFAAMVVSLMAVLASDTASWAVNGIPGKAAEAVNRISVALVYLPVPLIVSFYVMYTDFLVLHDAKRLKKLAIPLAAYAALDMAFTLSSVWTGWCYTFDAGNNYIWGPYVSAHTLPAYAILLITVVFVARHRKRIDPRRLPTLLTFGLPPVAAWAIQLIIPGLQLDLELGGLTISILLLYINIQDKRLDTDYLTGIYNRRLLDSYVEERIKSSAKGKTFSAILIDLDDFKLINDNFGHVAGDDALLDVVGLLKSCLRHGDLISRYGGDEFLIILDIASQAVLEETVERIRSCFDRFNRSNPKPYALKFSTGYAIYDMSSGMDPEQFIKHIDKLMYDDKKRGATGGAAPAQVPPPSQDRMTY